MWTISGPFDAVRPDTDDAAALELAYNHSKSKLLKTGKSYRLGRKGHPLSIDSPKISKVHADFIVGAFSEDDVANPSFIPTLTLHNLRDKAKQTLGVWRGTEHFTLGPQQTLELQDGDIVHASSTLHLTVRWRPICCFFPPSRTKLPVPLSSCATLGIYVVSSPISQTTHYLTPTYSLSGLSATALLSASNFVKPEWLTEFVRLSELDVDSEPTALENECDVPQESKFKPGFQISLPHALKKFDVWAPNEARLKLFKGFVFLCVGEKGREVKEEFKEAIERGEGSFEVFDCTDGTLKWVTILKRTKKKAQDKLVLLANEQAVKIATGDATWSELVEEAGRIGSQFVDPSIIVQAAALVDTSILAKPVENVPGPSTTEQSSPLPDFVPNTHPDEPSIPPETMVVEQESQPAPVRKLTRRGGAAPSSRRTSVPPEGGDAPAPRKLVRRARAAKAPIIGIDDPSIIEDESETPQPAPAPASVPPTPARPTRLKRRAGTAAQTQKTQRVSPVLSDAELSAGEERPTKKFKQLFDETDPDRVAQSQFASAVGLGSGDILGDSDTYTALGFDPASLRNGSIAITGSAIGSGNGGMSEAMGMPMTMASETQTQTQTQLRLARSQAPRSKALIAVREEEEEETQASLPKPGAQVRDVLIDGSEAPAHPSPKKSIGGKVNEPVPPESPATKTEKKGAEPGRPDTDAAFLKALASKKKGKKTEDAFDREFNNLRISRPDIEREKDEADWKILEDFGDDVGVRGNFMVVMELDVYRKEGSGRRRAGEERPEWEGKKDFKKFKRKVHGERRAPITLVPSEQPDGGIGSAYWGKVTYSDLQGSQVDESVLPSQPPTPKPQSKLKKRAYTEVDSDASGQESVPSAPKSRRTSRQPASRAGSAAPQPAPRAKRAARGKSQQQPLFIDSDSGDDAKDGDFKMQLGDITENFDAEIAEVPDEDDDDDDALPTRVSRSQKTRKASIPPAAASQRAKRATRAPAVIKDDDSDDGMTFKGFGGVGRKRGGR